MLVTIMPINKICTFVSDDKKVNSEGNPIPDTLVQRTRASQIHAVTKNTSKIQEKNVHTEPQTNNIDDWRMRVVYSIFAIDDACIKSYLKLHLGLEELRCYGNDKEIEVF